MKNPRHISFLILYKVIAKNQSLSQALSEHTKTILDAHDRAFIKQVCFGVCRWYFRLTFLREQLVTKPLPTKHHDVAILIYLGLYQLLDMRIPEHAAVNETVKLARTIKKTWATQLINGVLRQFIRNKDALMQACDQNEEAHWAHPQWFIDATRKQYPQQWQDILEQNNQLAPQMLRVNQRKITRAHYLEMLQKAQISAQPHPFCADGITIEKACDITQLPGFTQGMISVQDGAAQLAAELLNPEIQQHVLDACSAPGGKLCHLLERNATLSVVAIDNDEQRMRRVKENLARLGLNATLIVSEAENTPQWWDNKPFDKILLDAPCSATGVIRRHPDIKIHRKKQDINQLVKKQRALLESLWPCLAVQGQLLYATCSILAQENDEVITSFLASHANAQCIPIECAWGNRTADGKQFLPNAFGDGFYYACLQKVGE